MTTNQNWRTRTATYPVGARITLDDGLSASVREMWLAGHVRDGILNASTENRVLARYDATGREEWRYVSAIASVAATIHATPQGLSLVYTGAEVTPGATVIDADGRTGVVTACNRYAVAMLPGIQTMATIEWDDRESCFGERNAAGLLVTGWSEPATF